MAATETVQCFKCLGKGYFPRYTHIADGKCFACHGTGRIDIRRVRAGQNVERPRITAADDILEAKALGARLRAQGLEQAKTAKIASELNGSRFGTEQISGRAYYNAVMEGFSA